MEKKVWKDPRFVLPSIVVCLITGAYPIQAIDFNGKLLSMIPLIFVTYYLVIRYKMIGAVFSSFFYVVGFVVVALVSGFQSYHTNAVMAFQVATLISIWYLQVYVRKTDELNQQLYDSSMIDDLTGIWNKRYYRIKGEAELARAERYDLRFALILMDVDRFKMINDQYGHLFGDKVLQSVAVEVGKSIRKEDTFCRYGGDEFVIVVSNYDHLSKAKITDRIDRAMDRVNEQVQTRLDFPLTLSLGFGVFPDDSASLDGLFHCADQEMYRMKIAHEVKVNPQGLGTATMV